jgi:drug/metabolite transporter (DMT)-like permease
MIQNRPLWLLAAPIIFLIFWSSGFSIAKFGVAHAEPLTFLALRYAIVLVILLPAYAVLRPPLPKTRAAWVHTAIVGFFIQAVYFGMCYVAFKAGVSAGGVAIIVCLQPILVGLIAPYFAGERVGTLRWIGLLLGLGGAATVILARSTIAAESVFGIFCAIMGLGGITAGTLWEKRFGTTLHPVVANLIQFAAGLAATLPFALMLETLTIDWTWDFIAALAYLVIANSIIAMSLLIAMIRAGEVSRVSALFYLVPPMSALMAWPLLGEHMPPLAWAGMALAALGVWIASRKRP